MVVLVNQGERPLRLGSPSLTGPEAADFRITGTGSCHRIAELAAGSSCESELAFAPTQSGARNARLQWAIGGSTQFVATDLAGQADSSDVAWLWVDTARLTFDEVVRQPPRPDGIRRIILANRGRAPLSWQGLAVTGAHSDDFQLGGNCDARSALTPGQQCELTVQFRPGEAGLRSASLVLWPAGEATAAMVTLSGTAVAIAAPALAALPAAAPSPLRWLVPPTTPTHERTAVGETAVSERWTVHNRSALPVSALRWHIDGEHATDFSVQADSGCILGQSLAPSASCTLVTRFHPSAAGPRRARLVIATADAGGGPPEVAELQALAFAPAGPALLAAPGSLNFESVVGTRPTPRRLWVENTGAGLLPVTSITLSSGALARTPTQPDGGCTEPPFVLGPGQRCAVDIEWNGVAMGGSAGLLIQSDSAHWTVPIGVSEDPAQRSNVGTGGGALGWSTFGLWLAVCALGWARRSESRNE